MSGAFGLGQLPEGREGKLLAAAILAALLGALWLGVASPLLDWHAARGRALEDRLAYARHMAAIAADLPAAREAALAARQQVAPPNMILAGNSDPIAGAALESLIDGLTHDAGATLISTEAEPAVQVGAFRKIGLHVTTRAAWARLVNLLAAIERATPRMSIGSLQINAGPLGGAEQVLDMSFTVSAFRAGTAAPEAADSADTTDGASP